MLFGSLEPTGPALNPRRKATVMSFEALPRTVVPASKVDMKPRRGDWGPWRLDPATYVLYPIGSYRYEVDLEDCTTSAQVLDWLSQVAGKSWADDATLAGLVRAIDDVLNPQACLCSCGQSGKLTKAKVRLKVDRFVEEEVLTDG